ncbi:TonB-dependent receptor family protein [Massilia yuzhufengensis]|uniref:Iron complex outermembrane recepter protein n=1 Tax=Massilia yuzhufengensis TaxID=1164594 RepID=A0A1I1T116_9BURK|nr:TonB-dependent receptor [Massilia yuzhufengensis]SFD49893.1 iron complex outermembrane recepter protein [Massilia yuzhufengensis]
MNLAALPCSAPAFKPLALACALSLSILAANAAAQDSLPSIVITGARFPAQAASAPIGATVITAEDIRRAGATDVNAAIRKVAGVYGRQSLDASPDFALDLRGFGSNSAQNLVILVDGVRLNENELANAVLSSIPVDTVERIEIQRGGSSVLYGEGATGGVINIITRRAAQGGTHGSLFAEGGRFDAHDLRASLVHGAGPWSFDAAVANRGTDNYRANSEFKQKTASAGLQYTYGAGRAGLRFERSQQDARFPGSLTEAQFLDNPRQSLTLDDFGTLDTDRASAFVEHRIGNVELAAELSRREREVQANYFYMSNGAKVASRSSYDASQTQFSPRVRHTALLGGQRNELVAGVDLVRWTRETTSDFSLGDAEQESSAFYLRNELLWNAPHNARLAVGGRHEKFKKDYSDPLAFPPVAGEHREQSINAWSLEGSIDVLPQLTVFAKAGRSYRIANVDENSLRSGPEVLAPQTSRDLELGVTAGGPARQLSARVFRHRLENEIFYDPTIGWGANTNLDPTRRQGLEIEGQLAFGQAWRLTGQWQKVDAEFSGGPNAGREMVLVPKNVVTTRLAWTAGSHNADVGAQWVDRQRVGNDFTNSCGVRIPSYTTVDARYAYRVGAWEAAVTALNLADRQYYSNAFGCRSGIYPSDGRQLKLSLRVDF